VCEPSAEQAAVEITLQLRAHERRERSRRVAFLDGGIERAQVIAGWYSNNADLVLLNVSPGGPDMKAEGMTYGVPLAGMWGLVALTAKTCIQRVRLGAASPVGFMLPK
jgi:hypothetical protein